MAQQTKKQNLALREFGALDTQAARQVISDNDFSWLAEWMPIGHGNMKLVPGPSTAIATISVTNQTIFYWMSASINAANYVYCFLTDGSAYEVNTDTGAVTNFAAAGTFSTFGVRACQWKNERILIVDPQHGYFSYDRQTLISYQNTIYSVTINVAGGGFTTSPVVLPSYGNATFSSTIGAANVTAIVGGGTGYQVGDILQIVGGTYTSQGTIRVTAVGASNAITGAVVNTSGAYTVAPANPASVTGGYGTGATFNIGFALTGITVTNRGSGYTTIPTLLINPSSSAGSAIPITLAGNYTVAPSNPSATTGGAGTGMTVNCTFGLIGWLWGSGLVTTGQWGSNSNLGYQIGDILTLTGGAYSSAATIQITNIVVSTTYNYYYNILSAGNYTSWPTNGIFGVTGGHGSGLQVGNIYPFGTSVMGLVAAIVAATGSGYLNNDALTISGGTFTQAAQVTYKTGGSSGGAILNANLALSISGTAIASYSGHVWIVTNSRTVVFSAPASFDDFLTADGAGSFILTDEQMKSQITALRTANDYLYIAGVTSVFIVSGVNTTTQVGASPVTTFSLNNLTTSFGTTFPDSMLPHYRSMLYGSKYGWYMLTGVTPQKISNPLDGLLNNTNLGQGSNVTAGQCIVFGQLCECWLVSYTDPATNITQAVILIYFNGKWFLSVQNSSLKMIVGSVYNNTPTLYGTDGSSIYRLFSDSTTQRTFNFSTKMWDMGNPLVTKQITRVGIETSVQATASFNVSMTTEKGSNTVNMSATQAGYFFARSSGGTIGNYIGLTISGTATPGDTINGLYMAYSAETPWVDAQGA